MEKELTNEDLEEKIEKLQQKLKNDITKYHNRFNTPVQNEIERKRYEQILAKTILEDEAELKQLKEQKSQRDIKKHDNGLETESLLSDEQAKSPEKLEELVEYVEKLQNELNQLKKETGKVVDSKTNNLLERKNKMQELINEQEKFESEITLVKGKITQCIEAQKKALIEVKHKNRLQHFFSNLSWALGKEGRLMRKAIGLAVNSSSLDQTIDRITKQNSERFHEELEKKANMVIEDDIIISDKVETKNQEANEFRKKLQLKNGIEQNRVSKVNNILNESKNGISKFNGKTNEMDER